MTVLAEKIIDECRDLTMEERILVADKILSMIHHQDDSTAEAWDAEIGRRCEEIDNGTATLIDSDLVFAKLRAKYQS